MSAKTLPDIPGARRWIMVSYRILDAGGAREQEGALKLYTSRWAFHQPYLMAEVMQNLGLNPKDFIDPRRGRFDFIYSFMQVPHPVSSMETEWITWVQNQEPTETQGNDPKK